MKTLSRRLTLPLPGTSSISPHLKNFHVLPPDTEEFCQYFWKQYKNYKLLKSYVLKSANLSKTRSNSVWTIDVVVLVRVSCMGQIDETLTYLIIHYSWKN